MDSLHPYFPRHLQITNDLSCSMQHIEQHHMLELDSNWLRSVSTDSSFVIYETFGDLRTRSWCIFQSRNKNSRHHDTFLDRNMCDPEYNHAVDFSKEQFSMTVEICNILLGHFATTAEEAFNLNCQLSVPYVQHIHNLNKYHQKLRVDHISYELLGSETNGLLRIFSELQSVSHLAESDLLNKTSLPLTSRPGNIGIEIPSKTARSEDTDVVSH